MSRKPFEPLVSDDNNVTEVDCPGCPTAFTAQRLVSRYDANAAIAQDKEYALRRIREENHEGVIYYRERDEARAERDALREEVAAQQREIERLKAEVERLTSVDEMRRDNNVKLVKECGRLMHQLTEAVKVLDGLVKHCAEAHYEDCSIMYDLDEEKCDCGSGAAHDKAREFLAKLKENK